MTNFNTDGELVFTVDEWMLIASAVETFADGIRDIPKEELDEDEQQMVSSLEAIHAVITFWLEDQSNKQLF